MPPNKDYGKLNWANCRVARLLHFFVVKFYV
jgi:hypothetical protein